MSSPSHRGPKPRTFFILTALLIAAGVLGCAEEIGRLEMAPLAHPEGGVIMSLAVLEQDDDAIVFAPTGYTLYVRAGAQQQWEERRQQWPPSAYDAGLALFDGMRPGRSAFTFSQNQRFTAHAGILWTVAAPTFAAPMRVLMSRDMGLSWQEAPIPAGLREARETASSGLHADNPVPHHARRLRLIRTDDDRLYLTDSRSVWGLDLRDDAELSPESWSAISRDGIVLDDEDRGANLPPLVRHYLPATDQRPYEVLTVVQDQLSIYIRPADAEQWVLSSVIPDVDRQLIEIPSSPRLMLVTANALYQSDDHGERWERLPIAAHASRGLSYNTMLAMPSEGTPQGYMLFLGATDGSIWRSLNGGGEWSEVHPRDPDGRAITTFAASPRHGLLWAATQGRGVIESRDGGQLWSPQNQGLRATRILAMAVDQDRLVVGTEAGLFRQTGDPRVGSWTRISERGTSALMRHPENRRLFIGTLGGSIITQHPDGREFVGEAAPLGEVERILYQPLYLQSAALPPSAIVDIEARPGSQHVFAWTHQLGHLRSNDAGASWRRVDLTEALRTALQGDVITDFKADQDQRLYFISRPFEPQQPSQIWRSVNNGESWHAVYSFQAMTNSEASMRIGRGFRHPVDVLFRIHGDRVALSRDQGSSWSIVNGGWEGSQIRGLTFTEDVLLLVTQRSHSGEIYLLEQPDSGAPVVTTYNLAWPEGWLARSDESIDAAFHGQYFFMHNVENLYAGVLPRRKTRLPAGIMIALSIFGLSAVTAASFAVMQKSA
jgi:hypothetical protein